MQLRVSGIPTADYERLRGGGPDAHGQPARVRPHDGLPSPCRHCLGFVAQGQENLVAAYRPFAQPQPYAEVGPIFLHRERCQRYQGRELPGWLVHLEPAVIRGYDARDWIRYATGQVLPGRELAAACARVLADPTVAYVHVRSRWGCYQCRVDRA